MISTGMSRELDSLGRIVIPKELRNTLNISTGNAVMFLADSEQIGLKKYMPGCVFCGEVDNFAMFHGYKICEDCRAELSRQA